ncbi:MAG: oligopeptidase, partial [Actinomycetota bacterium]|nr:oligopeptidase [Actinomycetota bacterium]
MPPAAPTEPSIRRIHGVETPDPYAWMRNRKDPRLIAYLREERAYYEETTARLEPLRAALRSELERRLPDREDSTPWRRGPHSYFWRTPAGTEHAVLCRRGDAGPAEVVLDAEALAGSSPHFRYGVCEPSPDGGLVAYSVDLAGDEVYELRFRDPASGSDLEERIPHTSYGCAWSSDSTSFFYVVPDTAYRPWRVLRHEIGTEPGLDVVVYSEADERFHVCVGATRSGCWIVVSSGSRDTNEQWLIPAADPTSPARCVEGRRRGVEYFLEHLAPAEPDGKEGFVILTNDCAPEYRVVAAPVDRPMSKLWKTVVPGSDDTRLHTLDTFARHLILHCR